MLTNHALLAATLIGAASIFQPVHAQDVPTPPPAGVKAVPRRTGPVEANPQQPAQAVQPEDIPAIPENPIKLEEERQPIQTPPHDASTALPEQPAVVPGAAPPAVGPQSASRRPATPRGPVYYFAPDPFAFPANVTTPPAMHIPNSPFVEDLSVAGDHGRYTYYSYRRPWYTPGQLSANVTIVW